MGTGEKQIVPKDIQDDADALRQRLFNSSVYVKSQSHVLDYAILHYISGRMDERNKQNDLSSSAQLSSDVEDAARVQSEIDWPYDDFRGKNIGVDDEHTGQALRGAYCDGFEKGVKWVGDGKKQACVSFAQWLTDYCSFIDSTGMWVENPRSICKPLDKLYDLYKNTNQIGKV